MLSLLSAPTALTMPPVSPTGVANKLWSWRGFNIRYQEVGTSENPDGLVCILVHGLFVNADHWRRNLPGARGGGLPRVRGGFARLRLQRQAVPDERRGGRRERREGPTSAPLRAPEVELGTASGGRRRANVDEAHPLGSVYNFYTWAEQLNDFAAEVAGADAGVTLIANSIGSISALQAAIDQPERISGVAIVNPNFRELHVAEQPALLRPIVMPAVRAVQSALRENGQPLFDALAKPGTVKQILREPYADADQVTDELVDVLLTPLLGDGAADVVFDTLSYSAGPLPEQQLQDPRLTAPVSVVWGEDDPWTPRERVLALDRFERVERVVPLAGVGHCPHDEAPQLVNPILVDFVKRTSGAAQK